MKERFVFKIIYVILGVVYVKILKYLNDLEMMFLVNKERILVIVVCKKERNLVF